MDDLVGLFANAGVDELVDSADAIAVDAVFADADAYPLLSLLSLIFLALLRSLMISGVFDSSRGESPSLMTSLSTLSVFWRDAYTEFGPLSGLGKSG